MSIRRSPSQLRKNFTVISNRTLADERLSWEARGLLAYLLSKPDNWRVSVKHLVKISPNCGRVKTYRIIKELEDYGYLTQEQTHDDGGKFGEMERVVHEICLGDEPSVSPDDSEITVVPKTVSGSTAYGSTAYGKPAPIIRTEVKQELIETRTDFNTSTSPLRGDGKKAAEPKPFTSEFEQLWAIYPRRIAKQVAYKKVVTRLRSGVKLETLLSATIAYAEIRQGQDASFTLHPGTFYGDGLRYEDYLEGGTAVVESRQPKPNGAYSDIEAFLQRGE